MADDHLILDEVRKMAAGIGMTHLTDGQLQELLRSTQVALVRCASLHTDTLTYADEPSHVFNLTQGPHDD